MLLTSACGEVEAEWGTWGQPVLNEFKVSLHDAERNYLNTHTHTQLSLHSPSPLNNHQNTKLRCTGCKLHPKKEEQAGVEAAVGAGGALGNQETSDRRVPLPAVPAALMG